MALLAPLLSLPAGEPLARSELAAGNSLQGARYAAVPRRPSTTGCGAAEQSVLSGPSRTRIGSTPATRVNSSTSICCRASPVRPIPDGGYLPTREFNPGGPGIRVTASTLKRTAVADEGIRGQCALPGARLC